jgi:hypothetical protein
MGKPYLKITFLKESQDKENLTITIMGVYIFLCVWNLG